MNADQQTPQDVTRKIAKTESERDQPKTQVHLTSRAKIRRRFRSGKRCTRKSCAENCTQPGAQSRGGLTRKAQHRSQERKRSREARLSPWPEQPTEERLQMNRSVAARKIEVFGKISGAGGARTPKFKSGKGDVTSTQILRNGLCERESSGSRVQGLSIQLGRPTRRGAGKRKALCT